MNFQDYIVSKGWVAHRRVFNKKWEYVLSTSDSFTTLESGGLDIRYLKDGKEIIFGLNEAYKPPTLIWPRPKEAFDESIGYRTDDKMNQILLEKTPEEIFNLLEW